MCICLVQRCLQAEGQLGRQAVWAALTEGTSAVLDPGVGTVLQHCLEVRCLSVCSWLRPLHHPRLQHQPAPDPAAAYSIASLQS